MAQRQRPGRVLERVPFPCSCPFSAYTIVFAGVWSRPVSEEDLLKWESLVIGPALSPYAFGFFTFRMQVCACPFTAKHLTRAGLERKHQPSESISACVRVLCRMEPCVLRTAEAKRS